MKFCQVVIVLLLLSFGICLSQSINALPNGRFPCRIEQASGLQYNAVSSEFDYSPAISETFIETVEISGQTYTSASGSGEYTLDGSTGVVTWLSGPLQGWNSRLEQYSDGSFTVRFATEATQALDENFLEGERFCDLLVSVESQTTLQAADLITPLPAGEYPCSVSSYALDTSNTMTVQTSISTFGSITLDGNGSYGSNTQTGTYVYSSNAGFTFTRGPLVGWPTLVAIYPDRVELHLASSLDHVPGIEAKIGDHICTLFVDTSSTGNSSRGVQGNINKGYTGTLTFRDEWSNDMIDTVDIATGVVTARFDGTDPDRAATGETVFVNNNFAVVIVDANGLVEITFPADINGADPSSPVFSPDNSMVAYALLQPYDETHVIVRKRDGTKIADFTNMLDPSWTPDGRLVMASNTGYEGAPIGIFLSDAALTNLTRIDPNLDDAANPAVSPDGQTIAFEYHGQIWLMGIDGSNPRQLATIDGGAYNAAWSPDGQALVVLRRDDSAPILVGLDGTATELESADGYPLQVRGQIDWQ